MSKNEIAIVFGKFNPAHRGHLALYNHLRDYAQQQGIGHRVYTGTSHFKNAKAKNPKVDPKTPLHPELKLKHLKRVLGTEDVHIHSNPFGAIEDLLGSGHSRVHIVLGTDRIDDQTAQKLKDQFGDRVNIVAGPKRDAESSDYTAKASSTLLRRYAAENKFDDFKNIVPEHMPEDHVREYFQDVREGLRKANELVLGEEVSTQTRIKLSRIAKRTSKRREILRKLRERRRKPLSRLKIRAKNQIKDHMRKKVHGGNWKKLSFAQRASIDKRLARKPVKRLIDSMTKRIMPKVIQGESERLKTINESLNPAINSFLNNYLSEARKAEKPKRQPLTGEKKIRRRAKNRTNQRNKRTRDDNSIQMGDIRGKVLGVKDDKGRFLIISKRSYNPNKHTKIVDPERATKGALEKFLNNDKFVNTDTSQKLFGFKEKQKGGGKGRKKTEDSGAKKEKGTSKQQSAKQQSAKTQTSQQEPGEWDLEEGSVVPTKRQSKNCSIPTSHDAKIVEPAMAVFANYANGIDFKKQVEMGLVDESTMKAILKSPHKSLHESARRMGEALVAHYGQRVYFKVVGSKLDNVKLNKKAKEGGLTDKTSKADVHVYSMDTHELIDTASVKCGSSQASSGNWQDSTVGLQWTVDNSNKFGITITEEERKEIEEIISFVSDTDQYAGNERTARGPTGLYKAGKAYAGQDPTFTKKEKANKTLTDKMDNLFTKSPQILALYALTQMTGYHKFEENSTAIARTMIAVSHDGTQVKIAPIDYELARQLKITIASRVKSGPAASKQQELEWDNLQEQAKKSGKKLTALDDFRPYAYRNTIRVTINEVDLKSLKENKLPLSSMNGISIFRLLTENAKKDSKLYNVGTSPEEIEQNLKDLKEISKEDPMQALQILNSAFEYDDLSPFVDFLDILPTNGYTFNRIYINDKEFRIPVQIPSNYPVPGMEVPQVSLGEENLFERNYRKEYDNYHSKPEQRKNRSKRVLARRLMQKLGKVHKGDGKDVDHKDGNPQNNGRHNLRVRDKSENRADN